MAACVRQIGKAEQCVIAMFLFWELVLPVFFMDAMELFLCGIPIAALNALTEQRLRMELTIKRRVYVTLRWSLLNALVVFVFVAIWSPWTYEGREGVEIEWMKIIVVAKITAIFWLSIAVSRLLAIGTVWLSLGLSQLKHGRETGSEQIRSQDDS